MERKDTPLDENGRYDFETVDAIDIDLFNEQVKLFRRRSCGSGI